jgi:hypothetical protein
MIKFVHRCDKCTYSKRELTEYLADSLEGNSTQQTHDTAKVTLAFSRFDGTIIPAAKA